MDDLLLHRHGFVDSVGVIKIDEPQAQMIRGEGEVERPTGGWGGNTR